MNRISVIVASAVGILLSGTAISSSKTFVYCSEGRPDNFTPALTTASTSIDTTRPMFNRLVDFDRGTTNIIPGLASSWEVADGGKTITFQLRHGVKFHSGVNGFVPTRDFNADDVLFSFNRQWLPDHPYAKVSGGKFDYFNSMDMPGILQSIEKVDYDTVVFKLKEANAPFLANIAMDFASIQSAEYADFLMKAGKMEEFDRLPVGTGPFQFVTYQTGAVIRYKAFADYWGGKAAIDDLVFAITPDPSARLAKLNKGECHLISAPRPADIDELKKNSEVQLFTQPGLNVAYWAFNTQKKPFDSKEVRQALNMAIDKAAILKEVYLGAGQAAINVIPPTIWSYNNSIKDYAYDPAKAKAMLAEAGVTGPLEIDLWYNSQPRPHNPNAKRVAEMMQADLAKVGIDAKLVTYEKGEFAKRLKQGEHMTAINGWTGDNGDPDNFFFLLSCAAAEPGGLNFAKWCNKEFDADLIKARTITDVAERTKLYEKMQVLVKDEAPWLTLAHSTIYEAARSEVVGYRVSPFGRHDFYGVDLK